jgi:predicted TPR repeat methyltransferase
MSFTKKARNVVRGAIQKYGPEFAKKHLWDNEFSTGHWNCLDRTGDDRVHLQIEKYANGGAILDLGCGSGTTSLELDSQAYSLYTGVDISDVAVNKARSRAAEAGRADRNEYCQSDILTFTPVREYDVIFWGDSIYYIPPRSIVPMLHHYAGYLTAQGIFIARMFDVSGKHHYILDLIERDFDVAGKRLSDQDHSCLVAFRPPGRELTTNAEKQP